jgi:hypothetical protein
MRFFDEAFNVVMASGMPLRGSHNALVERFGRVRSAASAR